MPAHHHSPARPRGDNGDKRGDARTPRTASGRRVDHRLWAGRSGWGLARRLAGPALRRRPHGHRCRGAGHRTAGSARGATAALASRELWLRPRRGDRRVHQCAADACRGRRDIGRGGAPAAGTFTRCRRHGDGHRRRRPAGQHVRGLEPVARTQPEQPGRIAACLSATCWVRWRQSSPAPSSPRPDGCRSIRSCRCWSRRWSLRSTWLLLKASTHVLMEGVPAHLPYEEIGRALTRVPGVEAVHDLHVWQMTSERAALSAHLLIRDAAGMAADPGGGAAPAGRALSHRPRDAAAGLASAAGGQARDSAEADCRRRQAPPALDARKRAGLLTASGSS